MRQNSAETVEWLTTACNSGDLSRTALAHELCVPENWFGLVLLPRVFDGEPLVGQGWRMETRGQGISVVRSSRFQSRR